MQKRDHKVIPFSSGLWDRLMMLLAYKWKGKDTAQIEKNFTWRYLENPYTERCFVYLAESNSILVGFRAFVLQKYLINNVTFDVFCPADAIVHPSFRRMGVFSRLTSELLKDLYNSHNYYSVILSLSSNKRSLPGNIKQGWCVGNGRRKDNYKISFRELILSVLKRKHYFGKPVFGQEVSFSFEISQTLRASELATFWQKHRHKRKISNIRDEKFFLWRFGLTKEKYNYMYCYDEEQLVAYLIIRKKKGLKSILEEYGVKEQRLLKPVINSAIRELGIPVLKTLTVSDHQSKLLYGCGFFQKPDWYLKLINKKALPVLIKPVCPQPEEKDYFVEGVDCRDMENWIIYKSDEH